jgi:hypothetical protein
MSNLSISKGRSYKRRKPCGNRAFICDPIRFGAGINSNARAIKEGSNMANTHMIMLSIWNVANWHRCLRITSATYSQSREKTNIV